MAIKPIPTVTSLRTTINIKTMVNFDFGPSFSKSILTSYYDTCDCEGDYDINEHNPIKNRQPMRKNNLKRTSGGYGTTQTITFSWKNKNKFHLPQVTEHALPWKLYKVSGQIIHHFYPSEYFKSNYIWAS